MSSKTPQQSAAVGGAALADPLDASTGPPAERDDCVSWHLSPGYSTHLHAYELAMLPGDARPAATRERR